MGSPYDDTFMSILMQHKSELEFLNSIFSFLQRRTKYFHPDNKGAEDNFESLIEVLRHQKMQLSQPQQPASQPAKPKPKPKPKVKAKVEAKPQVQPQPQPNAQTGSAVEVTAPEQAGATETTISEPPAEGDADDDVPRKKLVGNGTRAKQLAVTISKGKLAVGLKGEAPLVDGPLHKEVKASEEESYWTLEDNKEVTIFLQKVNDMEWWKTVIQGDEEIDTQLVEPENSKLDDLDGETRQTVEKMMYDQRQKALGLPSSEDQQKQEMMKKFMAQHPEMDFSNAKMN